MTGATPAAELPDKRFVLAVGGLMLVIILLLPGLWLRMRKQVVRLRGDINQQRMMVQSAMAVHMQQLAVKRDELPTRDATLDGRRVKMLRVSADAGAPMGFLPGDVIIIEAAPASRPAGP